MWRDVCAAGWSGVVWYFLVVAFDKVRDDLFFLWYFVLIGFGIMT